MRCVKLLLGILLISITGCSSSVSVVDLNKVLDIFQATLTELDGDDLASVKADELEADAKPVEEQEEKKKEFVAAFRKNLNNAVLISSPIGVVMHESGTVNGFGDKDNDNIQDTGETNLFKIEIDIEGQRLVASDGAGHYRDHTYRRSHGFFTGYMLSSMMHRNRSYYSGSRSSLKPNYGKTAMSPKTYHKSAVSKARTAARAKTSSARARSGSGGFSFGK